MAEHVFRHHKVIVDIEYVPYHFNISHNESEKLLFDGKEIHKVYNQLVRKLD